MPILLVSVVSGGCGVDTPLETAFGPVASLAVAAGDGQTGTVGQRLPIPLEVRVVDASGVGVPGATVNFVVTAGGGSVLAPYLSTDESGSVSVPWTLGYRAGEAQRLLVAVVDPGSGASFGFEFNATAQAGAPASFEIESGNDQLGGAGSVLSQPLVVRVLDVFENGVPGVEVAWLVNSGRGSLSQPTTTTSSDGLASVDWTLGMQREPVQSVVAWLPPLAPLLFEAAAGLTSAWEVLPDLPVAVRAPAVAARGNSVYVVGGHGLAGRTNVLQIFDVTTGSWSMGAPVPASADWWSAAFVGEAMHLVGGVIERVGASDQHWIYDPQTDSWTAGAPLPIPSAAAAIASDGSGLYLIGGRTASPYSATTRIYDGSAETWSIGPDAPGQPRTTWAGDWIDGEVLAAGGEAVGRPTGNLYAYDPGTRSWDERPRMLRVREAHGAAAVGGYFCVFGGRGVGASVECYLPETETWADASSMPSANEEIGAVALGGAAYVVGGRGLRGSVRSDFWRFTLGPVAGISPGVP